MRSFLSMTVIFFLIDFCQLNLLCCQESNLELAIHLAQAANDSEYCFVRAKFEPGEVHDPWAVRFFDSRGNEVRYFVWDSLTWNVAREGRFDWGHRYAILNHHPGNAPEALQMRSDRLRAAEEQLPELGSRLRAQDEAAREFGNTVCLSLYLLRYRVPALGKDKLTMRVYSTRQVEPLRRTMDTVHREQQPTAAAGELVLKNVPDEVSVQWRGKQIFRYAGFELGDKTIENAAPIQESSHVDLNRPCSIEIVEGLITQIRIHSHTSGRAGNGMSWQCIYWLFPEGAYAALKGFSLENAEGYLGGGLTMARLETANQPQLLHEPSWEKPWWLFQATDATFVSIHQFTDTPLTVGYGNNPFNVSTPGSFHVAYPKDAKEATVNQIRLHWSYELTDKRIYRLFHPRLDNDGSYDLADITNLRETLSTGKLSKVSRGATKKDGTLLWPPDRVRALEEDHGH